MSVNVSALSVNVYVESHGARDWRWIWAEDSVDESRRQSLVGLAAWSSTTQHCTGINNNSCRYKLLACYRYIRLVRYRYARPITVLLYAITLCHVYLLSAFCLFSLCFSFCYFLVCCIFLYISACVFYYQKLMISIRARSRLGLSFGWSHSMCFASTDHFSCPGRAVSRSNVFFCMSVCLCVYRQ